MQVPAGSRFQRCAFRMFGIVLSEDEYLGLEAQTSQAPRGLQSVHGGHANIHHDDFGPQLSSSVEAFVAVRSFSTNTNRFRFREHSPYGMSKRSAVVDQQDSYG